VDPLILTTPQAKIALGTLAMQAVNLAYQTHRPAQAAQELAARLDQGNYRFSRPGGDTLFPGCDFYPNGWRGEGHPEWYLGPVTIRLLPDGSLEYRDGDWIGGHAGKFTQAELQTFMTSMDQQIPQLALLATQQVIVDKIAEIAPIKSQEWVTPTVRAITITL
jgi:hypothetical protein